jgi:hypothetical protein
VCCHIDSYRVSDQIRKISLSIRIICTPYSLTNFAFVTHFGNSILVTAAHCASFFKSNGIFLGGTTLDGSGATSFDVDIEFPHPNYGTFNLSTLNSELNYDFHPYLS